VIAHGERVFVDSGAWIALALVRDAYHERARAGWEVLGRARARLLSSVPVVLETFTYLDRHVSREVAHRWRSSLGSVPRFDIVGCSPGDLVEAWQFLERKDLHKLSAIDATSFVLMRRHRVRTAFAFDTHFTTAGFRLLG